MFGEVLLSSFFFPPSMRGFLLFPTIVVGAWLRKSRSLLLLRRRNGLGAWSCRRRRRRRRRRFD